jgi:hypothetical protein
MSQSYEYICPSCHERTANSFEIEDGLCECPQCKNKTDIFKWVLFETPDDPNSRTISMIPYGYKTLGNAIRLTEAQRAVEKAKEVMAHRNVQFLGKFNRETLVKAWLAEHACNPNRPDADEREDAEENVDGVLGGIAKYELAHNALLLAVAGRK